MPNSNDKEKYILQSVSNALDVLEFLADHKKADVPEIARQTGLGKSSVFRILATLESKNYVRKSKSARYSLDTKLIQLGQAAMEHNSLLRYGHSCLEALMNASGETSHMSVLTPSFYCRFIDKVVSNSTIHMDSYPGFSRFAHYMASGKLLLAYSSETVQENYAKTVEFCAMTVNSILSWEALSAELTLIRERGYALDREESEYGLMCVAAPVRDNTGTVVAAVSISGPVQRMIENLEKNVSLVTEAGKQISERIASLSLD